MSKHFVVTSSALISLMIAGLFSGWFVYHQLHFVAPDIFISSYPIKYMAMTAVRCSGVVIFFFLISHYILNWLSDHKINALITSLTFLPLLFVYANFSLLAALCLILLLQLGVLICILNRDDYRRLTSRYLSDATALTFLLLIHLFVTTAYSPLNWSETWQFSTGPEEIPVVAPIFKGYVLAKQFVFSTMDYSAWAGALNPPITLSSFFMELLAFIFDLPSISVESFHHVLLAVYFILIVMGSFGFYLFLKYALKVQFLLALFGGCLFYLVSDPNISNMTHFDAGIFIAPYAVFSYGLLLISLAFEKNNLLLSAWSGVAIASQFFLLTPHPEGVLYSFLFFSVFMSGLLLFSTKVNFKRKILLALVAIITLLSASAFMLLPIIIDQFNQNIHTFAHLNDVNGIPLSPFYKELWIFGIFASLAVLLLCWQKKMSATYGATLFLAAFLLLLLLDTSQLNKLLASTLHIGIHVSFYWRIGLFFCLAIYSILIVGLDAMTKQGSTTITLLVILCASLMFQWQPVVNKESAHNPQHCQYYITLQSLLTSLPLLANDQANINLIKSRLIQFENNVSQKVKSSSEAAIYSKKYHLLLENFHLKTIQSVISNNVLISFAQQAYPFIDDFYLNAKLYCINPVYNWHQDGNKNGRVLRYNLSGLYKNIPDHYLTIVSAVEDTWLAGPSPGLFLNNQTTTLDTRFMTGMPLLTALYVLPKYDYDKTGGYLSPAPWNYLRAQSFRDPVTRKLLNISGIDVFTVTNDDLGKDVPPAVKLLSASVNQVFDAKFKTFINTQSYGLVYLANHIAYEKPDTINADELLIKNYFKTHASPAEFHSLRNALYDKLFKLQNKYDIILESDHLDELHDQLSLENQHYIKIVGIAGERANFIANCPRNDCIFVFNIAKSPGWHAYVNSDETKILRANLAFMAVSIPHGVSHLWFIYEPSSHVIGDIISLICLIGLGLLINQRRQS